MLKGLEMAKIIDRPLTGLTPVKVLTCEKKECGVDFAFPTTHIETAPYNDTSRKVLSQTR